MPNAVRLALVITELEVGGAENCLVNLATGIDRGRFAPVVYSLAPRPAAASDTLVRRLEDAGIETHFLGVKSKWQFLSAVTRLQKLLAAQLADIVQTFLFHANVVGALAARQAKIDRICLGIRVADPSRSRHWIERGAARRADRIVCVSQSVADFCRTTAGFPEDKLVVIPNGVNLARFAGATPLGLAELGVPAGRRALLFVGRLDRQKGLDVLLPAMPKLFEQLPLHDLVIVGEGPQRRELETLAGGDQRIHFTGRRSDVPNILAAADVLVLPSRYEGMPNVLLEAMAAGKPVVATRAEGVMELLGDGAEQQTAELTDLPGFLGKIAKLANSADTASQLASVLGSRNQMRVKTAYSMPAMIDAYEALYGSLASGNAS